jgi:antitoxin (DNA-binding transcriptional repressor) of toxin-antitoxin stability system
VGLRSEYFQKTMTTIINIETSKYQLSDLLALVRGGNEVIVQEANQVIARVLPPENHTTEKPKRYGPGLFAGSALYIAEDFDDELPMSFWLGEDE